MIFDGYIMVDWSAASKATTGADSIWVAEWAWDMQYMTLMNYPTRAKVRKYLKDRMKVATAKGDRLLVGFDFPFGYPAKAYDNFKPDNIKCENWEDLWNLISTKIKDNPQNVNNRFKIANRCNMHFEGDGPFWGREARRTRYQNISTHKPGRFRPPINDPLQFRIIESYATSAKSVWQLAYTGCVGSQVLMGIPTLQELKDSTGCLVWPFDPVKEIIDIDSKKHVIAEIYPSIWNEDNKNIGLVKDAGQVKTVVQQIACYDKHKNKIFQELLNAPYEHKDTNIIRKKEGWILGVDEKGKVAEMITDNRPHLLYV